MLHHPTANQLETLGFHGPAPGLAGGERRPRAKALSDQINDKASLEPSFEDRLATLADAILDRLAHNAYRIELKGDSMRRNNAKIRQQT